MKIKAAAAHSDPGRKRRRNEDNYVCEPPLFAVTDGMGGAQAGELASALAADALREGADGGGADDRAERLVQEANRRVFERASADASASGMGTTATVAIVDETSDRVIFAHVGDSRAYLIRDGSLEQLTDDHSLVAELVRSGKLSPEEAETHPQRSVITRVLGTDPEVDVDSFAIEARPNDLFLICSDGLSTMVGDDAILDVAERYRGDLNEAVRALLAEANRGGGEDNITAVLFEIGDPTEPDDGPPDETREMAVTEAAADPNDPNPDDEDTLSPLDAIRAEDVTAAAAAAADGSATDRGVTDGVDPDGGATDEGATERREAGDTMVVPVEQIEELRATEAEANEAAADHEEPSVSFWRRLLALVVILALIAMIVVLVVWGLAR